MDSNHILYTSYVHDLSKVSAVSHSFNGISQACPASLFCQYPAKSEYSNNIS